jgi:alkanesulfonate monooxygenase SsuD/methylene tetrahydromethanopterin reductase-like flavin-dependent oxidoreductase (luciferase family)
MITSRYTLAELVSNAEKLDKLGFDHLKVGDHTLSTNPNSPYPNSQVVLAWMAAHTERAKLSTAVTDPLRRHPVEIAHWIATLDQFSGGRAALGIGAGEEMNLTPFGISWERPLTKLKEAVEVIKKLWEATPTTKADYIGDFFSLTGAYLQIRPLQKPRPKVYIGAIGKKTRILCGELADGYLPMATETPESLRGKILDVKEGASKVGRDILDFDIQAQVYTDVSDDEDAAYRSVESTAKGGLIWERDILKQRTGMQVPDDLTVQRMDVTDKKTMESFNEFAERIPRKLIEEVAVAGSVDSCISKLEKLVEAGATSVIICNLSPDQDRVFQAYGKEIFPYLRERFGK